MDWGFENPNKTAALIALMMIAVWVLPLVRQCLFWVALPVFAGLGVCLVHTMSRGGLIAAFAGLGVVVLCLPRPWPRSRVVAIGMAAMIMLGGAVALQATARFAQSYKDSSISNRLEIWKRVPQMMVDAPGGWELGRSGEAFTNWYQPTQNGERYRTLVGSHVTWLVEFGWPFRILYVFAWSTVFVLCYPPQGKTRLGFAIALGLWVSFFVASLFSSVAEELLLWALPVLALLAVLIARTRQRAWPNRIAWISGAGIGCAALISFFIAGSMAPARKISVGKSGTVYIGSRNPKLWVVVSPSAASKTVSLNYPRDFREYSKTVSMPSGIGFAKSITAVPNLDGCSLMIMGTLPKEEWRALMDRAQNCQKLILLSPNVMPGDLKFPPDLLVKTTAIFGEFSASPSVSSWESANRCQQIEGVGDFFQNWPEVVFTALN